MRKTPVSRNNAPTSVSDFSITFNGETAVATGALKFGNASPILKRYPSLGQAQQLDLSQTSFIDSAGLSVLLHWQRAANRDDVQLKLRGLTAQQQALIRIAGLQDILPAEHIE